MRELPKPECPYGYPETQLERILGDRMPEFFKFMRGQTVSLCEGREYNYERKAYFETGHTHGVIFYEGDVRNFLGSRRWID